MRACKEDGISPDGHVGYERRHVKGSDLKEWAKKIAPSERPEFLFDDAELATHPTFKTDDFNALKASLDASNARLEQRNVEFLAVQRERDRLSGERACMEAAIEKISAPGARSETTYLNIIGGLLGLMLGKSPAGVKQSVFQNQAAVISALLAHHGHLPGISASTLDLKFADANRSIKANG